MAEGDFGPKADVTSKIIEFLSAALAPTADGNYTKTVTNILQAAYSEPGKQTAFRNKLQEWQVRLHIPGDRQHDPISHVPAGSVQEFYVAPWQLSFDPDVSVKGLPPSPLVTLWFDTHEVSCRRCCTGSWSS